MNFYAHEKIRELERELLQRRTYAHVGAALKPARGGADRPRRPAVFGPAARLAGRTLRRLGEGLEGWANPPQPEAECQAARFQR